MSDADKTVRIGGGAAMWGDTQTAPGQLVMKGRLDYLMLEYLAEVTMSILAAQRMRDPGMGWARDFVPVVAPLLPEIKKQGIRIVTNAGGVNPAGCRDALQKACEEAGIELKIAVVTGDDLMSRRKELAAEVLRPLDPEQTRPDLFLSMNAYLGALPIAAAFDAGADVVITGRCVDSALALGPLLHEFGWSAGDYDLLSAGSLAGHLLECGAQSTGGNFTDWRDVPGYENMGFPIAECSADGSFLLTKAPETGGLVNRATVAEQMLYEIGDPAAYVLPDVICDWREVTLEQADTDVVRVAGARGRGPTDSYKVSATYPDGFRLTALFMIGGIEAAAKARRVAGALLEKNRRLLRDKGFADYRQTDVEAIGSESMYGRERPGPETVRRRDRPGRHRYGAGRDRLFRRPPQADADRASVFRAGVQIRGAGGDRYRRRSAGDSDSGWGGRAAGAGLRGARRDRRSAAGRGGGAADQAGDRP
jgi:hypothetical protein